MLPLQQLDLHTRLCGWKKTVCRLAKKILHSICISCLLSWKLGGFPQRGSIMWHVTRSWRHRGKYCDRWVVVDPVQPFTSFMGHTYAGSAISAGSDGWHTRLVGPSDVLCLLCEFSQSWLILQSIENSWLFHMTWYWNDFNRSDI